MNDPIREAHVKLFNDMDNLTYPEYRTRLKELYTLIPYDVSYNFFDMDRKAKQLFEKELKQDSRIFKINVGNIPDGEIEAYIKGISDAVKLRRDDMEATG